MPAAVREELRDHLFLSYAWEDGALCEWLFRKLTAAGYRVWCDRFKLLGGERWPRDIDVAIRTRAFRMIALLSRHSLQKDNPTKERQMALTLARERHEDFLLPLNVDDLAPSELGWQLTDINYIPFGDWAKGLRQLLLKLDAIAAPRSLGAAGASLASETYTPENVLKLEREVLYANCLAVNTVPRTITKFSLSRPLADVEVREMARNWAFKFLSGQMLAALTSPPSEVSADLTIVREDSIRWSEVATIGGFRPVHIMVELVKKSLTVKCVERGLQLTDEYGTAYFPRGLLPMNRLTYLNYKGKRAWVRVLGERRVGKARARFQLGIAFWVRRDVLPDKLAVETKVRLYITDPANAAVDAKTANRYRKKIAKNWWNHDWLSRQLALTQFLAEDKDEIVIGAVESEQVRVAARLMTESVTPSINDSALEALRARARAVGGLASDDDEEDSN